MYREVEQADATYALREQSEAYGAGIYPGNEALRPENTILWQKFSETAET
jgi:hypothetical protein